MSVILHMPSVACPWSVAIAAMVSSCLTHEFVLSSSYCCRILSIPIVKKFLLSSKVSAIFLVSCCRLINRWSRRAELNLNFWSSFSDTTMRNISWFRDVSSLVLSSKIFLVVNVTLKGCRKLFQGLCFPSWRLTKSTSWMSSSAVFEVSRARFFSFYYS